MKRFTVLGSALLGLLAFLADGKAFGQYGRPGMGPYANPAISPYLQLNRTGAPVALNYYNLVRPQFSFQTGIMNLQQGQYNLTKQYNLVEGDLASTTSTGHAFGYFTHTRYFMNNGGMGRGGGGRGAGAAAAAPAGGGGGRGRR